jgi:hypothetical protein
MLTYMLPEDFTVYIRGGTVLSWPADGFTPRVLPTVNRYHGEDGGYIAMYSRDSSMAVYSVGDEIYAVGQVRLSGRYRGRIFHPTGYEGQDISAVKEFKDLCRELFGVDGWAGGDTFGWFGL